ncbi:hypothetical protein BH10PSE7_BH10PSE7_06030 [soil metagenome]
MIGGLIRSLDNMLGRGEAAVTVPPLDGALRPNRKLDEAASRLALANVDCLAVVAGELVASAGSAVYALRNGETWQRHLEFGAEVTCIAATGDTGLAVALASGDIALKGGDFHGRIYRAAANAGCITAMAASDSVLYIANGSAANAPQDWQLDLLQRHPTGSIWQIELADGGVTQLAAGLAFPAGLAVDGAGLVYSEAWKHRLVRLDLSKAGQPQVLYADLPGYPGRIAPVRDGYWLAVFAPRSQLVELVLREPGYRKRMVAEVPRPYWIAPKLRSGRSFYEPLQGGGVKHLGLLKPWAPTMSAGLCVGLDNAFQPRFSLHSRADGATHGVTCLAEYQGHMFAAARGDDVVISIPVHELGGGE